MDAASFERVYEAFRDFHAYFSPLFGRRESRERSGDYLQAVLVQSQDRRNAENLSESVGVSARGMQRFLTDGSLGRRRGAGRSRTTARPSPATASSESSATTPGER